MVKDLTLILGYVAGAGLVGYGLKLTYDPLWIVWAGAMVMRGAYVSLGNK